MNSNAPPVSAIVFGTLVLAAALAAFFASIVFIALGDTAMHAMSVTLRSAGWL